jgi:hypothetical protein
MTDQELNAITDKELIAAKHCATLMQDVHVNRAYFYETSTNEYAKAFRRHAESTSDTMRKAVEYIREGRVDLAAAYLEGFIIPDTINVEPNVSVFLDLYYAGDKRYLDSAVNYLEALQAAAAARGLKASFEDA